MSDDSDFDEIAHEKLLESIKTPNSTRKTKLKKVVKKSHIDAGALLSHITVSRASTNKAKQSLGIEGLENPESSTPASSSGKRKASIENDEQNSKKKKKKVLKSKTLIPVRDIEARKRIEGEIAFKDLKKEVTGNWTELVQSNRVADQLIFPLVKPEGLLWGNEKSEPKLTEKEQAIMKATDIKMAKERLGQMQRMRAIVGIQEAKNRYLKKIKSKGYHRILKREKRKQLLKEFDEMVARNPEKAHEKLEELDLQRVMERGSLKHRGQNQKFKQMLEKHASRNPEVKKLLEEHLRLGRELKSKVAETQENSDSENEEAEVEGKKKLGIHEILKDAAKAAAKDSSDDQISSLFNVDDFLEDTKLQKLTLAQMRAKKRLENEQFKKKTTETEESPMFEEEKAWDKEKGSKKKLKKRKGTMTKKSYVKEDYDTNHPLTYEEKVKIAVEAAGVNADEQRMAEIEIDPRKFLELNAADLTQVSSDFVEKMDQFEEETANVINEAFKDDDVVGEFEKTKEDQKEREKVKDIDLNLAGWGSWTGPGTTENKRRKNFMVKAKEKKRKDGEKNGIIIKDNIGAMDGIGKIQPRSLPFPYSRVEDYEAVLKQPLGLEWNMEKMRDELCKPAIVVESGRAIRPINKKELIGEKK
ncbi:unnamed protein product [Caenorhabditis angaria]|uniref:Uncharacterized protein n=1 Tax=Caenorhabditis angaria TaxID=860376 RepID=A0A9P1I651_9PELO|nr:unnamed protein product [Caenorhabditis angaria]